MKSQIKMAQQLDTCKFKTLLGCLTIKMEIEARVILTIIISV
jgi:hypothetical protein